MLVTSALKERELRRLPLVVRTLRLGPKEVLMNSTADLKQDMGRGDKIQGTLLRLTLLQLLLSLPSPPLLPC